MKWILLVVFLSQVGCALAQKEYNMKNCKVKLSLDGVDEGERSCQRQSMWWD